MGIPGEAQVHSTPSLCAEREPIRVRNDGKVYAVDRHAGTKVWEMTAGAEVWASPVSCNGVVFFGNADAKVYALEQQAGTRDGSRNSAAESTPRFMQPSSTCTSRLPEMRVFTASTRLPEK